MAEVGADLTSSIYAMAVVAYGTLATSAYLFQQYETQAAHTYSVLEGLNEGPCAHIWEDQNPASFKKGRVKTPETKLREEYDEVMSDTFRIERWQIPQIMLFASVLVPAVALSPVLWEKVGIAHPTSDVSSWTSTLMVWGQGLASVTVPVIGLNLALMARGLFRRRKLIEDLNNVAVGASFPRPEHKEGAPANGHPNGG